jgi:hypothetical protein
MEIAKTIIDQIKATDKMALWAWGSKDFTSISEFKNDRGLYLGGLSFRVNGMKHKGQVRVLLHGSDTYHVEIGKVRLGQWKSLAFIDDVYCDTLMDTIDGLIER